MELGIVGPESGVVVIVSWNIGIGSTPWHIAIIGNNINWRSKSRDLVHIEICWGSRRVVVLSTRH